MDLTKIDVTLFARVNFPRPTKIVSLQDIIDTIKSDKYKLAVEQCKLSVTKSYEVTELNKAKLPCFLPLGKFKHRSIAGLESYNSMMCLDIDVVKNAIEFREQLREIPYIISAFVTPSYEGNKCFIMTEATKETYKEVEERVAQDFLKRTGYKRDVKDISRIQFFSHDPGIWVNPEAEVFK
jgi:hypothetical protein